MSQLMHRYLFLAFIAVSMLLVPISVAAARDSDHPWYVSNQDYAHARSAIAQARAQRWNKVADQMAKVKDPLMKKLFRWVEFTGGSPNVTFTEISAFIRDNPDWPDQSLLWRRSEEALSVTAPKDEVIQWFTQDRKGKGGTIRFKEPVTAKGKQLLGEAQLALKDSLKTDIPNAYRLIRQAWIESNFGSTEEQTFLQKHHDILRKEDYIARIDSLLWDESVSAAQRIMKYADDAHQQLFKARIALIQSSYGVDKIVNAVPKSLQSDEGLLYDRIKYRAKRLKKDSIDELLAYIPAKPKYPKRWWKYRTKQYYKLLEDKNYRKAYEVASHHGLEQGVEFAEAEWMSGWLALRYVNDPKAAYRHFYNLYQNVVTPISLARGAYWAARAAEINQNLDIAQGWYAVATQYPSTFYGQLAYHRLGKNILSLPKQPIHTANDVASYQHNELLKAAFILHNLDRTSDVKKFLKAASEHASTQGELALIAQMGQEIKRPDYGVATAREISKTGLVLTKAHYPVLPKIINPRTRHEVYKPERALIHSIILQESAFYKKARSSQGASGLMQLMPRTAQSMAKKLKLRYSKSALSGEDPAHNVTIGSYYLERLVEDWDGSYILATASYNGGPLNVKKWVQKNGDPREMKNIDEVVDWIESIPFAETRNYVQRVLENVQMYRFMLGDEDQPRTRLTEDLRR